MVRRKEEEKFLDVNAAMQGDLIFSDPVNLRINGKFKGSLVTKGKLIIGENANVQADILGENVTIEGNVKGKIRATERLEFTSTACVVADVETPKISIEEGANYKGKCNVVEGKISLGELSNYLSIEQDKIMEWVDGGKIPIEKDGSKLLFDLKEVEGWLAQKS